MIRFKEKSYTVYDDTDQLKQMKDSDIIAQKRRSNSGLNREVLTSAATGAGIGAIGLGMTGLGHGHFGKRAKIGAAIGAIGGALIGNDKTKSQRKDNNFYNDRLEYAQRHALRRERADWRNNNLNRDGYTY